jgi:hypothetical protein
MHVNDRDGHLGRCGAWEGLRYGKELLVGLLVNPRSWILSITDESAVENLEVNGRPAKGGESEIPRLEEYFLEAREQCRAIAGTEGGDRHGSAEAVGASLSPHR